jgi:hypothetical protein
VAWLSRAARATTMRPLTAMRGAHQSRIEPRRPSLPPMKTRSGSGRGRRASGALPLMAARLLVWNRSIDLLRESANSPHPPTPSPKGGEGEPENGSYGDFVVDFQVPLPTWERDLG